MAISESKLTEYIKKGRLEVTHQFDVPPKWLEIVNEDEQESAIFGTYGNFSTIISPPKVGKTTLVSIPIAAHITNKQIAGFQTFVPIEKENVLWIDTEQAKSEAVNTIKTICRFSNISIEKHPEKLFYYTLRGFGYADRVEITEHLIQKTPNLGIIVIDGIRDLINSINDEREATHIAGKLLKWSEEQNIHIITILHQNKGDGNARGHLGTELMNKAETVIGLSKEILGNERQTIVEPKYNRHKEFRKFAVVLRNNRPQLVGVSEYIPDNPKVNQLSTNQKMNVVKAVFESDTFLGYSKLWQTIQGKLKEVCSIEFGDNKSKELVKTLVNDNYIIHNSETKHYQKNV